MSHFHILRELLATQIETGGHFVSLQKCKEMEMTGGDTQDRGNEQPPHACCTGSTISRKGVSWGLFFPFRFLFSLQPCWEGLWAPGWYFP